MRSYAYEDTLCQPQTAIDTTIDLVLLQDIDVLIGPICDACTLLHLF